MFKLLGSQKKTIQKIHADFDAAQERLLDEAKRIITNNSVENKKAEALIRNGFVLSKIAVKHLKRKNELVSGKEQAELIEYYKQYYPFQKFITEGELDRICKKYNLIYAPVSNYKEDVPDINLKEIDNTPDLKFTDKPQNYFIFKYRSFLGGNGTTTLAERIKLRRGVRILHNFNDNSSNASEGLGRVVKTGYNYIHSTITEINRQGLFIAAPKTYFNLSGLSKHGLLHSTFTIVVPKDPIVFRFVRGGVQIITKWGLEGKDESLVNEKQN